MGTALRQPVAIPSGSGRQLKSLGIVHKLTRAQTNGAFYLCEAIFAPESGSPLHIHHYEDEVIHILEGAIDVRLDGQQLHAEAGGGCSLAEKSSPCLSKCSENAVEDTDIYHPGRVGRLL